MMTYNIEFIGFLEWPWETKLLSLYEKELLQEFVIANWNV